MEGKTVYSKMSKVIGTYNISNELNTQNTLIINQENTVYQLKSLINNLYENDINVVTADANIISSDVMNGKIGYAAGQRIVGTLESNEFIVPDGLSLSFSECNNLNLTSWNTSATTNMYGMFSVCRYLTDIDVSNWNTSNVVNMSSIFYNCSNLTYIDISNWNTSNVTSMSSMFQDCYNLTTLDVSNWDTSNVTSMSYMFYMCNNLTNAGVDSIINMCLNAVNLLDKTLLTNDYKSPFYGTSIINTRYQDRWSELTQAGWTY